jgi:hypothetical protein
LIVAVAFFFLNFFYVIPIAFVQSLANLEGIEKAVPFLKPLIEMYVFFNIPFLCSLFSIVYRLLKRQNQWYNLTR